MFILVGAQPKDGGIKTFLVRKSQQIQYSTKDDWQVIDNFRTEKGTMLNQRVTAKIRSD